MTPHEKALELTDRFRDTIMSFLSDNMKQQNAKKCALITVDEILVDYKNYLLHNVSTEYEGLLYWQQVKQEIEKL